MHALSIVAGLGLIVAVLADALATLIIPRRLGGRWRMARIFLGLTWPAWRRLAGRCSGRMNETLLSLYGPLSLLLLMMMWGLALILAFALLYWGMGSALRAALPLGGFGMDLYVSGDTFVTLGLGDVIPVTPLGRLAVVAECGTGLGFLAMVIGYMPVLYGAFSRREAAIARLDARAGSPATAAELLRRHALHNHFDAVREYLAEWEQWSAELLETHISYPMLGFFRSQHRNQSWVAALVVVLDASALLVAGGPEECRLQARLTFAMARHALVDVAQIFLRRLHPARAERLTPERLERLVQAVGAAGLPLTFTPQARAHLDKLRALYERPAASLAHALAFEMPGYCAASPAPADNWQRSPWQGIPEEHF